MPEPPSTWRFGTVVITGALTGIGRVTALAYARQGANLVISGRHQEPGEQFAKELEALGGRATFVRADVRFDADMKNLMDRAVHLHGRIDVAFNPEAALYVGSKYAVIGITKAAALEGAAHGIRVNAVAPGFIRTGMYDRVTGNDAARDAVNSAPGTPEEVADAVLFLGSEQASYLTSQVLTLDGGLMSGWPLFAER
ncbi:SDR family oxidoreductase [Streptomyces sp. NPDC007251]|uniref:SDR family NAD(P)-dependent oxidoreductase n=1 Tax=unclassified Streptomyces TaxID=2593676 RepID=UPI0033F49BC5